MINPLKSNNRTKCGISILPEEYFYPYPWEKFELLFKKDGLIDIKKVTNTFSVHFYGKLSSNFLAEQNSIYEYFAKNNCPYSYQFLNFLNKQKSI